MFTINIEEPKKEIKFPCLAKSRGAEITVLFTSKTDGVVVSSSNTTNPIGRASDSWVNVTRYDAWEIIVGDLEVVIQRKESE